MTLSADSNNILIKWERLRIIYNIVLTVVLVASLAFFKWMFGYVIYIPTAIKWIFAGAVLANVCFCAAPVIDFYSELIGLRFRGKRMLIFLAGTFLASGLTFLKIGDLSGPFQGRPFDRSVWLAQAGRDNPDNPRAQMVADLQHRYIKLGISQQQVLEILGEPDWEKQDNVYKYNLGMWSGFRMDYDSLDVYFDPDGLVIGSRVVQH